MWPEAWTEQGWGCSPQIFTSFPCLSGWQSLPLTLEPNRRGGDSCLKTSKLVAGAYRLSLGLSVQSFSIFLHTELLGLLEPRAWWQEKNVGRATSLLSRMEFLSLPAHIWFSFFPSAQVCSCLNSESQMAAGTRPLGSFLPLPASSAFSPHTSGKGS